MSLARRKYLVKDVMTVNPVTVKPSSTVWEAVTRMASLDIGALPVIDEEGKLVGIFTERDLLKRVIAKKLDPEKTLISEVMTPSPVSIDPEEPVENARFLMAKLKTRHLPVVDKDGRLIGIVSIRDIEYVEA
ncbi:MAG: CBS domain-containing protein [Desulfurococcales archaeon]|nr:CBS domain-containing protein [Desulfurococcales archaeon]